MPTNYYEILEVHQKARAELIHIAWRELSKQYGDGSKERYKLNEAYDVLSDVKKRKAYDESLNPPKGKRIGNYLLLDKIAEGGFAETYRAKHEFLDELVCIKVSHQISAVDEALMMEEAKIVWNLRHYAIPAIRDIVRLGDGDVAIVMSYVPGPNLQQAVEKRQVAGKEPIDPEHVCWIFERVINALACLHDSKIIHGDVKPANIIIQPEIHQAVLVDFGLALMKPSKGTANKGYTPAFASPEHLAGTTLLPESDFYSLGLSMIYALGGDPVRREVPSEVPDAVCDFINRLIAKDINKRPSWRKENLMRTMSEVRTRAFGSPASNRKELIL